MHVAAPQFAHSMEQDSHFAHSVHSQGSGHKPSSVQLSTSIAPPPSQSFPSYSGLGLSHLLLRSFFPGHFRPASSLHLDQPPQSPQPPSIGQGASSKLLQGLFSTRSASEQGWPPQECGVQLRVLRCSPGAPPSGEHLCSTLGLVALMQVSQRFHDLNAPSLGQQTFLQVSVSIPVDDCANSAQVFPPFNASVQPLVLVLLPSRPIASWQVLEQVDHANQLCHSASLDTIAVTLLEMPLIPNLHAKVFSKSRGKPAAKFMVRKLTENCDFGGVWNEVEYKRDGILSVITSALNHLIAVFCLSTSSLGRSSLHETVKLCLVLVLSTVTTVEENWRGEPFRVHS